MSSTTETIGDWCEAYRAANGKEPPDLIFIGHDRFRLEGAGLLYSARDVEGWTRELWARVA